MPGLLVNHATLERLVLYDARTLKRLTDAADGSRRPTHPPTEAKEGAEAAPPPRPRVVLRVSGLPPAPQIPIFPTEVEPEPAPPEVELPQEEWLAHAMRNHPDILQYHHQLGAFMQLESFARLVNCAYTESHESLSQVWVTQLLMQYLHSAGYTTTVKTLEDECHMRYWDNYQGGNALVTLLRIGIKDTRDIFDVMPDGEMEEEKMKEDQEVEVYNRSLMDQVEDEGELDDIPIWDELEDSEESVTFLDSDNQEIKSATLNKLVQRLTIETTPDLHFQRIFLFTYPSFTTPERLMMKLVQRYHVPFERYVDEYPDRIDFEKKVQFAIQIRVFNVMKNWIEKNFQSDFNEKLIAQVNMFVDNTLMRDGHVQLAKQLRTAISKQITAAGTGEEETKRRFRTKPPDPKVPRNLFSSDLRLDDVDEEELARQMTIIDSQIFCSIQPPELVNQAWSSPKLRYRAPNVIALNKRSDAITHWAALCILQEKKLTGRVKVMRRLARLTECLRQHSNYQSAVAVAAGLFLPSIRRLRFTREDSVKYTGIVSDTERLSHPGQDGSYSAMNKALKSRGGPCVPWLSAYLSQLVAIDRAEPDTIDGLINFQKRKLIFEAGYSLTQQQNESYDLLPVYQIARLCHQFPTVDDATLDAWSCM